MHPVSLLSLQMGAAAFSEAAFARSLEGERVGERC